MTTPWKKNSVIYHIYPRSYQDSNGDGIGDIRGIISRFDHIKSLGVDAIWMSPMFKSPMRDYGYDVTDYNDIDPLFGTMEDYEKLIKLAHDAGMKVLVDHVFCHTSSDHPWFKSSKSGEDSPHADWYVWRDAQPDGTEPNNWLSYFGGRAWSWNPIRKKYYLHHFLNTQPTLNGYNPQVREALKNVCRFWFDKGVDGVRLDAIHCMHFDPDLRDNAYRSDDDPYKDPNNLQPFNFQYNIDKQMDAPAVLDFMRELREVANEYDNRFLMAELYSDKRCGLDLSAKYVADDSLLHSSYNFDLLYGIDSATEFADKIDEVVRRCQEIIPNQNITFAFSNHDVVRSVDRIGHWVPEGKKNDFAHLCNTLLMFLPGSCCVYQGEELGYRESEVDEKDLHDPWGKEFYPVFKGRDGCRTPMAWDQGKNGGFSSVDKPWLPVNPDHIANNAAAQNDDKNSVLNRFRELMKWKKSLEWLDGSQCSCEKTDKGFVLRRSNGDNELVLDFDLTDITVNQK